MNSMISVNTAQMTLVIAIKKLRIHLNPRKSKRLKEKKENARRRKRRSRKPKLRGKYKIVKSNQVNPPSLFRPINNWKMEFL